MQLLSNPSVSYDATVKLKNRSIPCFTPRYMKDTYPNGGFHVVGEVTGSAFKEPLGTIQIGEEECHIAHPGRHSRLLWHKAGYLQVGDGEYIALLRSRGLLFIALILAAAILLLALLPKGSGPGIEPGPGPDPGPGIPSVIDPDQPLPPPDDSEASSSAVGGDEQPEPGQGGGSLTLVYTLDAAIGLSSGDIVLYFQNPENSTHDVTLELYVISSGGEYLIARSETVKVGQTLERLKLLSTAPTLGEGIYTGLYRLHCFDPATGAQATVVPEIAGVKITAVR